MCVCFEPRGLGSKAADKEMTGENTYDLRLMKLSEEEKMIGKMKINFFA
jgi:hypothetical protein